MPGVCDEGPLHSGMPLLGQGQAEGGPYVDVSKSSLVTINVKGLGDANKLSLVLSYLRKVRAGLAVLTESHLTEERAREVEKRWKGVQVLTNSEHANQRGITVVVLDQDTYRNAKVFYRDGNSRAIGVSFQPSSAKSTTARILGVYGPNTGPSGDLRRFWDELNGAELGKLDVVMGDFNIVLKSEDRNPPHADELAATVALVNFLGKHRMVDGLRKAYPGKQVYTFTSTNSSASSSRLDRIYVRRKYFTLCDQWCVKEPQHWTDHSMAGVNYRHKLHQVRGPGIWRMNTSLLKDDVLRN